MLFSELAASQLPDYLEKTVAKLLDLKMNSPEVKMIPRIDILNAYMDRSIERCVLWWSSIREKSRRTGRNSMRCSSPHWRCDLM